MKKNVITTLKSMGLSENELRVYLTLLSNGESIVTDLSEKTSIKRVNTYNVLKSLLNRGLIDEFDKKKKLTYKVKPPEKLLEYISEKKKEIEEVEKDVNTIIPLLSYEYNLLHEKSGVSFYEGKEGFKKIYEKIIKKREDPMIIVSRFHKLNKELREFINSHIERQAHEGIKAKAIINYDRDAPLEQNIQDKFKKQLTETRLLYKDLYPMPAQITIYGENVAITTFRKKIITVIIKDGDIIESFRSIFNFMWVSLEPEYKKVLKKYKIKS